MPNIGEIRRATEVGYAGRAKFVWVACPDCGCERWRPFRSNITRCWTCAARQRAREHRPITFFGIGKPIIGDTATAAFLGLKGRGIHTFAACPNCGVARWVRGQSRETLCVSCTALGKHRCELSGRWKDGIKNSRGYVYVPISIDDPLFVMVAKGNRKRSLVAEHRIVMARHLGRPLLQEEIAHHINGIKDDNRIINLQLLNEREHHSQLVNQGSQSRIKSLESRMIAIEAENVLLRFVLQEIRDSIPDSNLILRCYNTLGDLEIGRRYSPSSPVMEDELESA